MLEQTFQFVISGCLISHKVAMTSTSEVSECCNLSLISMSFVWGNLVQLKATLYYKIIFYRHTFYDMLSV